MAEQCGAQPMGGGACELEAGHEGKHFRPWRNREGGFEWDDESQRRLAERMGSRFD